MENNKNLLRNEIQAITSQNSILRGASNRVLVFKNLILSDNAEGDKVK